MPPSQDPAAIERVAVGAMTGTSLDGIDVAIVRVRGRGGAMSATFERHTSADFPPSLATDLRSAAEQRPMTAGDFARLARRFGEFHADVLAAFVGDDRIDLIAVHGQTVFHAPPDSWQLLNPAPIVARLRSPVIADLRQADLVDGGVGAPITPIADWVLFRSPRPRAIVNLGGFCNVTLLPAADERAKDGAAAVRGCDLCACNQILDGVARRALNARYDADGAIAARGRPDSDATNALHQRLAAQRSFGRSLGTGDEGSEWINEWIHRLSKEVLAASACEAVGRVIAEGLVAHGCSAAYEVLVAGGGARHRPLVAAIAGHLPCPVGRVDDAGGLPIEARESAGMAILGALAEDGMRIGLPAVTGRSRDSVLDGAWWFPSGMGPRQHPGLVGQGSLAPR